MNSHTVAVNIDRLANLVVPAMLNYDQGHVSLLVVDKCVEFAWLNDGQEAFTIECASDGEELVTNLDVAGFKDRSERTYVLAGHLLSVVERL